MDIYDEIKTQYETRLCILCFMIATLLYLSIVLIGKDFRIQEQSFERLLYRHESTDTYDQYVREPLGEDVMKENNLVYVTTQFHTSKTESSMAMLRIKPVSIYESRVEQVKAEIKKIDMAANTTTASKGSKDKRALMTDRELLAAVMYLENYNNGEYIMLLTGSVVLNRVKRAGWPNTIYDVLSQKGQYATWKDIGKKDPPAEVYALADKLLAEGSIAPENVVYQAMFKQGSGLYHAENGEYFCYE